MKTGSKREPNRVKNQPKKSKRVIKEESKIKNIKSEQIDHDDKLESTRNSIKKAKKIVENVKKETFDNKIKHLFDSIDSEKDVPYKPQLELTQFITLSSLDIPDEPKWSTKDTSKLIQLQEALGSNLDAMTKYFKERSRYSIRHHFFNILKWAAFEYSNDFNTGAK